MPGWSEKYLAYKILISNNLIFSRGDHFGVKCLLEFEQLCKNQQIFLVRSEHFFSFVIFFRDRAMWLYFKLLPDLFCQVVICLSDNGL